MYSVSSLFEKFPVVSHSRMVNRGFGVWMVWGASLEDSIVRSMRDFGGMLMSEESNQSYWFFFSDDVFRVVARLEIWARLNPMPVFMQVMPATLLVDYNLDLSLKVDDEFTNQQTALPTEFELLIHPKLADSVKSIVGLNNEKKFGLYEPAGGSAPDIAGKGIANPIAQILSAAMMLKYTFGQTQAADAIEAAISNVLDQGILTADLTDNKEKAVNTQEMGTEIINALTNTHSA